MSRNALRVPGLWSGTEDVWLTREGELPDEVGLERMTPLASVYLAHAWCSDSHRAEEVERFLVSLDLPVALGAAAMEERAATIAQAIESERVWVWERPSASVAEPSPFPLPLPLPSPEPKPKPWSKPTWIEIQLVDEDGRPIPSERYRLVLPDGTTRAGQLDERGFARVDGIEPGTCDVTFPDIDGREWRRKGEV